MVQIPDPIQFPFKLSLSTLEAMNYFASSADSSLDDGSSSKLNHLALSITVIFFRSSSKLAPH